MTVLEWSQANKFNLKDHATPENYKKMMDVASRVCDEIRSEQKRRRAASLPDTTQAAAPLQASERAEEPNKRRKRAKVATASSECKEKAKVEHAALPARRKTLLDVLNAALEASGKIAVKVEGEPDSPPPLRPLWNMELPFPSTALAMKRSTSKSPSLEPAAVPLERYERALDTRWLRSADLRRLFHWPSLDLACLRSAGRLRRDSEFASAVAQAESEWTARRAHDLAAQEPLVAVPSPKNHHLIDFDQFDAEDVESLKCDQLVALRMSPALVSMRLIERRRIEGLVDRELYMRQEVYNRQGPKEERRAHFVPQWQPFAGEGSGHVRRRRSIV